VGLARQLVGVIVLALPELEDQVQHAELHQHEDDGGDDEDRVDEVVDLAGDRARRVERVLGGIGCAGAEQQEQGRHQGQRPAGPGPVWRLSTGCHPPSSAVVPSAPGSWNSR
jgi:hypothetical protein